MLLISEIYRVAILLFLLSNRKCKLWISTRTWQAARKEELEKKAQAAAAEKAALLQAAQKEQEAFYARKEERIGKMKNENQFDLILLLFFSFLFSTYFILIFLKLMYVILIFEYFAINFLYLTRIRVHFVCLNCAEKLKEPFGLISKILSSMALDGKR